MDDYLRARADTSDPTSCWIWTRSVGSHGYGNAWNGVTVVVAHRLAYETWVGPIPPKMTVHHRCYVRRCINPAHLELLTNAQNASDNGAARRTHCPHGHPYSDANTYRCPKGHRRCRICLLASDHRQRARRRRVRSPQ